MTPEHEFYAPERVLIIVAHADDIEFGTAGTVARWTDAGTHVTYCIVTDNGSGSNDPAMTRPALVALREQEQRAAAAVVGVTDVRFLGYPDGTLQPTLELRRELTRLVRQLRPQLVLTMDPTTVFIDAVGYINHPDHRAVGEAAIYAVFPSAGTRPIFPELLDEGYAPHDVSWLYLTVATQTNLMVDITSTQARKIAALALHTSQIDQQTLDMVTGWDKDTGEKHGVAYAETFRVLKLRDDPPAAQESSAISQAVQAAPNG